VVSYFGKQKVGIHPVLYAERKMLKAFANLSVNNSYTITFRVIQEDKTMHRMHESVEVLRRGQWRQRLRD
jgi:hypothetical protein